MEAAPLFEDVARAPAGGQAWWLTASDGVRIRAAAWPAAAGVPARGTILLFPGRTEYIEKFGPTAAEYTARGFAVLTVDWRGQGLADRLTQDPRLGHVGHFDEFQRDIDAVMALAGQLDLPEPFFLVSHSMGGCIGLRALHNGLPVRAAAFSAPMWGMQMPAWQRPVAWGSSIFGHLLGFGSRLVPMTEIESYAATAPFEDNTLTSDREMFGFLQAQIIRYPDLALGGPTLSWLRAALLETTRLARMAPPRLPAIAFLGSHERIVEPEPVRRMMARWPGGELVGVEGAEHEILMETPATRARVLDLTTQLFAASA